MKRQDKVEFEKDSKGEWRWRYISTNGRIMADSAEGYKNLQDCRDALMHVTGIDEWGEENVTTNGDRTVKTGWMFRNHDVARFQMWVMS